MPADYVNICKTACKKSPYKVEYLSFSFFKNIEDNLSFYKSIRPGKKAGDPVVADFKALKYTKEGIFYKLRHTEEEWNQLPIRVKQQSNVNFDNIPQLYQERLKIKREKYEHLQQLKQSIEVDYHSYFDNLPHA